MLKLVFTWKINLKSYAFVFYVGNGQNPLEALLFALVGLFSNSNIMS